MEFDLGGLQGLVPLMPEIMMIDATIQRYDELMPISGHGAGGACRTHRRCWRARTSGRCRDGSHCPRLG